MIVLVCVFSSSCNCTVAVYLFICVYGFFPQWFTMEIVGSIRNSIITVFVVINFFHLKFSTSMYWCVMYAKRKIQPSKLYGAHAFSEVVDLYVIARHRRSSCHVNVNQDYYPVHKFMHIRSWLKNKKINVKIDSVHKLFGIWKKPLPNNEFPKRMFTQYLSQFMNKNTIFCVFKSTLFS